MTRLKLADLHATIDKEAINALPLGKYEGPIQLVDSQKSCDKALKAIKRESVLGFDTESRPAFRKGVSFPPSLIQLGGETMVYIFQLAKIDDVSKLFALLADPKVLKVGVAIQEDIRRLQPIHKFTEGGFVEIAHIAKELGCKYAGLRTLAGLLLRIRISKKAQISNWANQVLTETQVSYAATDAWISRELYLRLRELAR